MLADVPVFTGRTFSPSTMTMSGRATVWNFPGTMYGHDVIEVMRVHRDAHLGVDRPHGGKGLDHSTSVITLGKALSIHEAAFFEGGIGMQEPSLVINSTDGLPVPAPRIARRILAVVLLPTGHTDHKVPGRLELRHPRSPDHNSGPL